MTGPVAAAGPVELSAMGYCYAWEREAADLADLAADRGLFWASMHTGGRVADAMAHLGMVFDAGDPPMSAPDHDEWELAWHGPEIPGIPRHKIARGNDGWHVLPVEITAALRIHDQHEKDWPLTVAALHGVHPDHWTGWLDFLRGAAHHGGFRTT